jgi:tRNA-binding protein
MTKPTLSDFEALDICVGTVVRCEENKTARKAALALWIDFGAEGIKQSSAQITDLYRPGDLVGTQVVAVAGFEPMRVGGFLSEVLAIGALTDGGVVLLRPDRPVDPGTAVA